MPESTGSAYFRLKFAKACPKSNGAEQSLEAVSITFHHKIVEEVNSPK
jgi:hypothetical protein